MSDKWKMKWPLVLRKTLEREKSSHAFSMSVERGRVDREIREKSEMVDALLPKLFKATVERPQEAFGRFRVSVDFTDEFVYSCFTHGDSQEAIRYLAQRLSHMVEREIVTINFQRLARRGGPDV